MAIHRVCCLLVSWLWIACAAFIPDDREARPSSTPHPPYPPGVAEQRIEGFAVVEYLVSAEGRVTEAELLEDFPEGAFGAVSLETVRRWRFFPRREDGRSVEERRQAYLIFCIRDGTTMGASRFEPCRGPRNHRYFLNRLQARHGQRLQVARDEKFDPTGTWGWTRKGASCAENPHDIRFSEDGKLLLFRMREPVLQPSGESLQELSYRVIEHQPGRLRVQKVGETETTPFGELVVWDILSTRPDRHCWQRIDWPVGACTPWIERCERGAPPAPAADAEGVEPRCEPAAREAIRLLGEGDAEGLRRRFGRSRAWDRRYLELWLGAVLRELGRPEDLQRNAELDAEDFSDLFIQSRGLDRPHETLSFTASFAREGEGAVFAVMAPESNCGIELLSLGLPLSREDMPERASEIRSRISDALSVLLPEASK